MVPILACPITRLSVSSRLGASKHHSTARGEEVSEPQARRVHGRNTAGVDMGQVLVVRAGVRGSNDLISIGAAPNVAARLSDCREAPYRSFITAAVFDKMAEELEDFF